MAPAILATLLLGSWPTCHAASSLAATGLSQQQLTTLDRELITLIDIWPHSNRLEKIWLQGGIAHGLEFFSGLALVRVRDRWFTTAGQGTGGALWARPLALSRVTSTFGKRHHPVSGRRTVHRGVDYGARSGTQVYAVGEGVARRVGESPSNGLFIELRHPGGFTSWYLHLSKQTIKEGQRVHRGDPIGLVGRSGLATGPHLHFELRKDGKALDPLAPLRSSRPAPPSVQRAIAARWRQLAALCN